MLKCILAAISGCLAVIVPLKAQSVEDYTFSHLGIESGVAGPHIFSIAQTPDGVVWWSTKNTVDRYNGSSVRNYRIDADAPYTRFAGRTIGLAQSGNGDLYAYDNKGRIFRYDLVADDFLLEADVSELMSGHQVILNHIYLDDNGLLLALNVGTFRLDGGSLLPVLDHRATNYILDCGGIGLLLCTDSGVFCLKEGSFRADFFFPCNAQTAFFDEINKRIWLGTFSSGLQVLDLDGAAVKAGTIKKLPGNPVRSIIALDDRTVLVGVDGFGVYRVEAKGKDASLFIDANSGANGVLHGNGVYSLLKDSWGNIFIGTYSGGVDIARPSGGIAEIIRNHNSHVNCVADIPGWGLVLGTDDGVSFQQGGRWKRAAPGLVVLDICADGNSLLLATFGKGVLRLDSAGKTSLLYSVADGTLRDDHVYSFCRSSDGNLWMGCLSGDLIEITPNGVRNYPVYNVQDIVQLPDGRMAVATADGVYLAKSASQAVEEFFYSVSDHEVNRYVLSLFVEGNSLWIASDGGGIYILDLETRECRQLTQKDGLPGNSVCSLAREGDGTMWIGTENGLCRMGPGGKIQNVNYIWELNREYVRGASVLTRDGRLLFGSTDGALLLSPGKVGDVAYNAPLHLISARLSAGSQKKMREKTALLLSGGKELKLGYSDNTFELNFECVNLRYQKDIAYQYCMDDGKWSAPQAEGRFYFAEVGAGTHRLRVRSLSRSSGLVLDENNLIVKVAQPLWNTWWMWILYGIIIVAAFIGAWQVHRLHEEYRRLMMTNPTLLTQKPLSEVPAPPVEEGANKLFVDNVTRVVMENISDPDFSIDQMCRLLGLSRTYLYMRLKAFTGESPHEFILFIRLQRAAVLLRSGEPVSSVSDAVGFYNSKYFSTVFKKHFGVSPSKYR